MNDLIVEPTINNCAASIISTRRYKQRFDVSGRKTTDIRAVLNQNSYKYKMYTTDIDFFHYWLCLMLQEELIVDKQRYC